MTPGGGGDADVGGNDVVGVIARSGVGLTEFSTANGSGALSSWGSITMVLFDDTSHRSSMRFSLKKSRPL